jgi:TATA-box binding protein (TBP) (component of TFIID and TFIIIB)
LREPKVTGLIFGNGKVVVIGARSEADGHLAGRMFVRLMAKLGFKVVFKNFKLNNLVGVADTAFPLRLERLADSKEHKKYLNYEPEIFAGLTYKMESPKCSVLVFVTGKVVITGSKSRQAMYEAFEKIYNILWKYRKQPGDGDDPGMFGAQAGPAGAASASYSRGENDGESYVAEEYYDEEGGENYNDYDDGGYGGDGNDNGGDYD